MKKSALVCTLAVMLVLGVASGSLADIIYNNVLITNVTPDPQEYVVTSGMPVADSFDAPIQMRGSIDTSIIGLDATLNAPVDGAVYTALIDGAPVWQLQMEPFVLTTPQSAVSAFEDFGWVPESTPVNNMIGIEVKFTLSPGASATILSDFEVTPEPATLGLIGLGGLLLVWRRRSA